jgi:hypothetical protein
MIPQTLQKTTLRNPLWMLNQHAGLGTFVDENEYANSCYPREIVGCGGFLTFSEMTWTINWHWEMLYSMLNIALAMKVMNDWHTSQTEELIRDLLMNPPEPRSGYIDYDKFGEPADKSSLERVMDRYQILCRCKDGFRAVLHCEPLRSRRLVFLPDSPLALRQYKDWWTQAISAVGALP